MFEALTDAEERGQVGIGTLIIFIAMVLVAAVAAGVLINTAGLLESRASDTGQDVQSQVSNQIDVVTATGDVNQVNDTAGGSAPADLVQNGTVEYLNLTVKKSPGSDDIDLNDTTVEYVSDGQATTLVHDSGHVNATRFTTSAVTSGASAEILDSTDERVEIGINATAIEGGTVGLQEGESVTLRIVDQSGAVTTYGVNVPDTISDESHVDV